MLVTKDEWTYPVLPGNFVPLIETGIINHFYLRSRDIEQRSKADTLAKAFTLLQALWVTVNIIARAAYHLPITPVEISTEAYVACVAITYAAWWQKPKDMVTPVPIYLPYDRERVELPSRVRGILRERPASWVHLSETFPEDSSGTVIRKVVLFRIFLLPAMIIIAIPGARKKSKKDKWIKTTSRVPKNEDLPVKPPRPADTCSSRDVENVSEAKPSNTPTQASRSHSKWSMEEKIFISDGSKMNNFGLFMALLFCGIHVAA